MITKVFGICGGTAPDKHKGKTMAVQSCNQRDVFTSLDVND